MAKLEFALFERQDGSTFRVCPDCALALEKKGMVKREAQHEGIALFKIEPGFTDEDCKRVAAQRHGYGED